MLAMKLASASVNGGRGSRRASATAPQHVRACTRMARSESPRRQGSGAVEIPLALVWAFRNGAAVRVDEHTDTALLLEALRPAAAAPR